MALYTSVQGGSRAGWKIQKPTPKPWVCKCGVNNPRYLSKCGCGGTPT